MMPIGSWNGISPSPKEEEEKKEQEKKVQEKMQSLAHEYR